MFIKKKNIYLINESFSLNKNLNRMANELQLLIYS